MGRFLNSDVFAATGQGLLGNNMFVYCGNNPVMHTDPTGKLFIEALIFIGVGIIVGAATGAYIAACDNGSTEDIIEGAVEGALTGGAGAAIGFFAAPITAFGMTFSATAVAFAGGTAAGMIIDAGVQVTSHMINEGSLDNFNLDEKRMLETGFSTGTAAAVPTFNGTSSNINWAIGSAIVGAEASVLIASAVIISHKILPACK